MFRTAKARVLLGLVQESQSKLVRAARQRSGQMRPYFHPGTSSRCGSGAGELRRALRRGQIRSWRTQFIIVLFVAGATARVWPQQLRERSSGPVPGDLPLSVDHVLANQEIRDIVVSPDGQSAAVVIQRGRTARVEQYGWIYLFGNERSDIWIVGRDGRKPHNITNGERDGSGYWWPVWSPDSRRIALLSTRGGDNVRLFVWDSRTGTLRRAAERGVQLEAMFGERGPPMAWLGAAEIVCALLPAGALPFRFSSGSPVRRAQRDSLWRRTERGTAPSVSILEGGVKIPEHARPQGQLALVDLKSNRISVLAKANIRSVAIAPNAQHAAIIADDGNFVPSPERPQRWPSDLGSGFQAHLGMHRRLGVVSFASRKLTWVEGLIEPRFAVASQSWAADASKFVVLSRAGVEDEIETRTSLVLTNGRVTGAARDSVLDRSATLPTPPADVADGLALRARSKTSGFTLYTSEPPDGTVLWTSDTVGAKPRLRLRLNTHLARVTDDVGKDTLLTYRGADGLIYSAHVILPAGYQPGKRYPVIVWVYPGILIPDTLPRRLSNKPHTSLLAFTEPNLFTSHGYVYVQPSIPMSTGNPIHAMPGYILPALDTLIAKGIADSTQLGLAGQSHGALATYGLLTQTTRFHAAVAINGSSDILHEYAGFNASNLESDFPGEWATTAMAEFESSPHGLWLGPTPWADRERWYRNNPIYHFDRVRTPLMIVHADNDIFYMSQADVAFQALHRLGRRVRYVRYWGEGHVIQSPANIRDLWSRMYEWFDTNFSDLASGRGGQERS